MESTTRGTVLALTLGSVGLLATVLLAQEFIVEEPIGTAPEIELVSVGAVPEAGTFFLLSDLVQGSGAPPYPCFPPRAAGSAVFFAAGFFLVDDSTLNPGAFVGVNAEAVAASIEQQLESFLVRPFARQESYSMSAMSLDPGIPGDGGGDTNGVPASSFVPPVYTTNDLWLEMVSKTNSTGNFVIHLPSDEEFSGVYDLFATTNLAANVPGLNATNWIWLLRTAPGQSNVTSQPLVDEISFYRIARTNDTDGDSLSDAMESLWSHSDPNSTDQDGDGLPDGWEWWHFRTLAQSGDDDFDMDGSVNSEEYIQDTDPNTIHFNAVPTTLYSPAALVTADIQIDNGVPAEFAFLVDSTNAAAAMWTRFSGSPLTVDLGSTQGWQRIRLGLRGTGGMPPRWGEFEIKLDSIPPVLTITNPIPGTAVGRPLVQLLGLGSEALKEVSYSVSNANGTIANEPCHSQRQAFDTNAFEYTGAFFHGYDLKLAGGTNLITIRASDLAGNQTTTNFTVVWDVSLLTNPPAVSPIWPVDGMELSGDSFSLRGRVDDPSVQLTVQIAFPDGTNSTVPAIIERDGLFWVENVRLTDGTTSIELTASNAAGLSGTYSMTVSKSAVSLMITDLGGASTSAVTTVQGTISDPDRAILVNDTPATVDELGNWSAFPVRVFGRGKYSVSAVATPKPGGSGAYAASSASSSGVGTSVQWDPPDGSRLVEYHASRVLDFSSPSAGAHFQTQVDYQEQWKQTQSGDWYRTFKGTRRESSDEPLWPRSFEATYEWSDADPIGTVSGYSTLDGTTTPLSGEITNPEKRTVPLWGGLIRHGVAKGLSSSWNFPHMGLTARISASTRSEYVVPGTGKEPVLVGMVGMVDVNIPSTDIAVSEGHYPWVPNTATGAPPPPVTAGGKPVDEWAMAYTKSVRGAMVDTTVEAPGHNGVTSGAGASEPEIYYLGPTNCNGATFNAIVGQAIGLSVGLKGGGFFPEGTTFSWSVPGYAVAGYSADANQGILHTNIVTTNSGVTFYWVDGGSKTVSCQIQMKGETFTVGTTFDVKRPIPQFSAEVRGSVQAGTDNHDFQYTTTGEIQDLGVKGGIWLSTGAGSSWSTVGIALLMSDAPIYWDSPYGLYACVQVVDTSRVQKNVLNGSTLQGLELNRWGLDTEYPLNKQNPVQLGGWSGATSARWHDTPASTLAGATWLSRTDSFRTYLMFNPSVPGVATIPVPMYRVSWGWSGTAKTNGAGGFMLVSSTAISPTISLTTEFPQWTNKANTLTTYTTNAVPFYEN